MVGRSRSARTVRSRRCARLKVRTASAIFFFGAWLNTAPSAELFCEATGPLGAARSTEASGGGTGSLGFGLDRCQTGFSASLETSSIAGLAGAKFADGGVGLVHTTGGEEMWTSAGVRGLGAFTCGCFE
mmetsp:Transcript_41194/g.89089  ORF Transcript_41194/g.89089 Transcript_41194/m.89089 type:complete len:129 (-) Transcript_41194:9-395(-)